MQTAVVSQNPSHTQISWRDSAAKIVEELFPATDAKHWDLLIDLRRSLLSGNNWEKTLDLFLRCRQLLEADHYLPFYRLRRLISVSLTFEAKDQPEVENLEDLLRRQHKCVGDLKKIVKRNRFEHSLTTLEAAELRIVEARPAFAGHPG